jgi:hypothetical protein
VASSFILVAIAAQSTAIGVGDAGSGEEAGVGSSASPSLQAAAPKTKLDTSSNVNRIIKLFIIPRNI